MQPPDDMEGEEPDLAVSEEVAVEDSMETVADGLSDDDVDRIAGSVPEELPREEP